MSDYQQFLQGKRIATHNYGPEIADTDINPILFQFQRDCVRWAVRKGRAAIFLDTGLGKTFIHLEWARLLGQRTLIVAPLSVARQTVREAAKLGIEVHYTRAGHDLIGGQNITNYELLDHFNPTDFGAVVLDECFSGDTPIDVFNIDKSLELRYIKDVRPGDLIYNAQGEDHVQEIYKRRINRAVRITVNGKEITCSENHPFFTLHGWRCAQDLQPGDYVMETGTAVRLVWDGVCADIKPEMAEVLRSILFSEMANEYTGAQGQSSQSNSRQEARGSQIQMVQERQSSREEGIGENYQSKPNEQSRYTGESIIDIASDEAQTFRAWGQRDRFDGPTEDFAGCARADLDSGISFVTGPTDCGLSHRLQAGLSTARTQNKYRGGWIIASCSEGFRPKEGYQAGFARVDSLEILEQGHPGLEKYRDGDGYIYFYDIKAARHPSFSVNGLLVHNSSILKALDSKTRRKLTMMFADTSFRLCCTATPAPNDHVELGNHAEFLGVCTEAEMRAMFFINANKEHTFEIDGKMYRKKGSNQGGQEWRLKHHAEGPFYQWLASWAISLTKPSDLGYDDDGFILPALNIQPQFIPVQYAPTDQLFFTNLHGIADRAAMRRRTLPDRLAALKALIDADDTAQWIVWVGLDDESRAATEALPGAVEVKGSDSPENKAAAFEAFQDGQYRILVTKGRIGGFGMNFQCASNMAFLGLNDSWELWYQCIRREWRYGQAQPVRVHVIMSDLESEIYHNVMRKDAMARRLRQGLIDHVRTYEREELSMSYNPHENYEQREEHGEKWQLLQGDSCERLPEIASESVDLSIYSPPFADLYVYNNSPRDLGNSRNWDEFFEHYKFVIRENLRVTKPGRLACVHTSDIPAMQSRDGYIGVRDFPGAVIAAYEAEGWTFVGRAFVQKNPQAQAIRTKSKALLFVQLRKDSADSRPALVDQILIFRKPGENAVPILPVAHGELDNDTWIEWAHGIWLGINESDTLQYHHAREGDDEKHICPLQLGTIERCLKLYSNPGETVLSPFAGIGSEGYQAVKLGRKFVGIELKPSYWEVAVNNLREAEAATRVDDLFSINDIVIH